ncbi:MAG: hypothetical protein J5554_00320 [Paludibacteraceae bacterium]|nr:hypothetical protein [Paludibacteraceae bacterium]
MDRILYKEIETNEGLLEAAKNAKSGVLEHFAFQGIDFSALKNSELGFKDCLFFGCLIPNELQMRIKDDCVVFPNIRMPFNVFPNALYNAETLYKGYDPEKEDSFNSCYDTLVYQHYISEGKQAKDIKETLTRSIHDHFISDAMYDLLSNYGERSVVGIMGGHSLKRDDEGYRKIVLISKELTEKGVLMMSGGGPGAMEATHLGAWMAGRSIQEVDDALKILCDASLSFNGGKWLSSAFQVMRKYPRDKKYRSLGIPTWFYGHEPATPFASDIAKYFDNSIREDGILAIAKGGIIYTPGSAGTIQEVFQDAAQNHYCTFGYASPMVFLGEEFFTKEVPVYPFIQDMVARGRYKNMILSITDNPAEVVDTIINWK